MIYLTLFLSFLQVGAFSIGGGYAAMPLIQAQVVTLHSWMTMAEFTDLVTIAEMTPGPIAVNAATFVGIRIAGLPGALVATGACILPSCFIVSLLAYVYGRYRKLDALQGVLGCLRPVVAALIASAGLSILRVATFGGAAPALRNIDWINAALVVGALALLRFKHTNPILVMLLCGAVRLCLDLML